MNSSPVTINNQNHESPATQISFENGDPKHRSDPDVGETNEKVVLLRYEEKEGWNIWS